MMHKHLHKRNLNVLGHQGALILATLYSVGQGLINNQTKTGPSPQAVCQNCDNLTKCKIWECT